MQFLADGAAVAGPTLLPSPPGAVVTDPEATPLAHGGFVVTWITAESHSLVANYAVFNAAGALVTDQALNTGYTTSLEAAALPNGGFVLLDAQADLFGQHATLSYESLNAAGQPQTALTVLDQQTSSGGLYFTDIEGQFAHGRVEVTFDESGAQQNLSFNPHGHGMDMAEAGHDNDFFHQTLGQGTYGHDGWMF